MNNFINYRISAICAPILSFLSYLIGGIDTALQTLLTLILIDFATGVIKALYNKDLNSKKIYIGIIRKCFELVIICVCFQLDKMMSLDMILRTTATYFYVAYEGLSILENVGEFVELPEFITKYLENLKEKNNKIN